VTYEPLHHKYRPQTFGDLVGQEAIARTLTQAIRQQRIAPAYLFTGPRGTGKTSSARILAKSLNCLQSEMPTEAPCGKCDACRTIAKSSAVDVIEIDAASNTGVDNIRELIERAQFAPMHCRYKVYVVDEVHMLSNAAFNALLKTLEEPPERVVFVLATTDPQRVLPTIISRCQRFDFRRIPLEAMVEHLSAIATQEGIQISSDAIQLVAQIAQGGLRDAESLLDQLSLLPDRVEVEHVWDLVGAVPERDLMVLLKAIARDDGEAVLDRVRQLMNRGREPLIVLQNLASFYRDLLIAKTAPKRNDLVAMTPSTWAEICDFAQDMNIGNILAGQQHLRGSEVQIKNTTQPRLWLEVTLLGLLPSSMSLQVEGRGQRAEGRGQRAEDGKQQAEGRGQKAEGRRQRAEDGKQQAEGRGQKAEGRRQKAEGREQRAEDENQPSDIDKRSTINHQPSTINHQPSTQPDGKSDAEDVPVSSTAGVGSPAGTSGTSGKDVRPAVSTAATSSGGDPDRIWQQVLQQLPPAPRALLKQHCKLLTFEGQTARISVRSQPLFKLAQSKLPGVEVAFQAIFGYKVKVLLQVAKSQEAPAAEPPPPQRPVVLDGNGTYNPGLSPAQSPPAAASKPPPSNAAVSDLPPQPEPGVPVSSSEITDAVASPATPVPAADISPAMAAPLQSTWEMDEVAIAAKRFADFFNGEVVSFSDDGDFAARFDDTSADNSLAANGHHAPDDSPAVTAPAQEIVPEGSHPDIEDSPPLDDEDVVPF